MAPPSGIASRALGAQAVAEGMRKEYMESLTTVPLLIIDDFGIRKLPMTAHRTACRRLGKTAR